MPHIAAVGTDLPSWGGDVSFGEHFALPTVRAGRLAFTMAGLMPADVDVAEVHDFFTGIDLISYEDLGFAERFEAHELMKAEVTTIAGVLPVNPSGGLKAKDHPTAVSVVTIPEGPGSDG
jgi:acetyl-CoA acetyltransferase